MYDILPELNDKEYIQNVNRDYDIHFCETTEIDEVISFIDTYWRKNHIFVLSRKLLDWQHYDAENNRYNFVISKHKVTKEIHSILGFVPTSHFDKSIIFIEMWLCIWMTRKDISIRGLGSALLNYLKMMFQIETISQLGISNTNRLISEHWNFETGLAKQYYFSNPNIPEVLSVNRVIPTLKQHNHEGWCLKSLSQNDFSILDDANVVFKKLNRYKSKQFFVNRYFKHPIYHYLFFAVINDDEISSIFVARECGNGVGKCLRIVDYIGEVTDLGNVTYDVQKLLNDNAYEYADFICVGLSPDAMKATGFIDRSSHPETIIPHYFEPFEKKNVDLNYAFKTINPEVDVLIVKADSDQDRPNVL